MHCRFDRDRHSQIVERLALPSSVGECLAYEDMIDVPPLFDRFAREHFSKHHSADDVEWRDMCPVYALALMIFGTYRFPADDAEIQALWEELAPTRLPWNQAKPVFADFIGWIKQTSLRRIE